MEKGVCKEHGEFILTEGCLLCLAEKRGGADCHISDFATEKQDRHKFSAPEPLSDEARALLTGGRDEMIADATGTALALQPGEDIEVKNYYDQAIKLKEYAESRVIRTIEDIRIATDDLSIISRLKKAMAEKKKEYLAPHQEQIKAINDNYRFWMGPIEAANTITRQKMTAFDAEQRLIRQKQEEINRKRIEAAQEEMKLTGELSESVNLVEVIEAPKRTSTDMGTASMMDVWKYEIVDPAALPREYMIPDHAMLNTIAKKHHDQKPVSGVRFYNEPTLRMSNK